MTARKPTLCIVAGPNGSGKTTTTVQLLNNEWAADSLYINPDDIAQNTFGDWNSPEAVMKAAEEATRLRYKCLSKIISRYYKSLVNAAKALPLVDRAYVYDNSVDNQLPQLLYRTTEGKLFKQYTDDIPEWALSILK